VATLDFFASDENGLISSVFFFVATLALFKLSDEDLKADNDGDNASFGTTLLRGVFSSARVLDS